MKPSYLIILLLLNFCWAAVYSAYKVVGLSLPTGGIVTLRFGLAALCLLFLWPWLPEPAPRGWDLVKTCLMGLVLYVLGQRLQVFGNQLSTAGNSSVLMSVEPILTSVAAALFLRERIGPRRIAGFAMGILGVVLLNNVWSRNFAWAGLSASLIFISSFVCEAAYSVIGKTIILRASVIKMLTISLLIGTGVNLLIDGRETFSLAQHLSANAWVLLILMAVICTAVGYTFWFVVLKECPVNVAALTIFAQSVFGVLIAAVWLKERLHWGQFWGSLVITVGLVLGLSRQIKTVETNAEVDSEGSAR
jgi:drug/metabolite transporter (DMT)-like permease